MSLNECGHLYLAKHPKASDQMAGVGGIPRTNGPISARRNATTWPGWWKFWCRYDLRGDTMGAAFDSIKLDLTKAISHAKGEKVATKVYQPVPVDVFELLQRMGLTQIQIT